MANQSGVINSWSLVSFARQFGKMQVGEFKNSCTNERFKACIFSDGDTRTFVAFSRNLGELTPTEIALQKAELQVVENVGAEGQTVYTLCKTGSNSWQDVDLGL